MDHESAIKYHYYYYNITKLIEHPQLHVKIA